MKRPYCKACGSSAVLWGACVTCGSGVIRGGARARKKSAAKVVARRACKHPSERQAGRSRTGEMRYECMSCGETTRYEEAK